MITRRSAMKHFAAGVSALALGFAVVASPTWKILSSSERANGYNKLLPPYYETTDALTPVMHHLAQAQSGNAV